MIRVYLVDDHDVIRAGIKQILELDKEIRVVGEASRALDAIHALETGLADLVFMDIRMPGMNGWEVLRRLKATRRPEEGTAPDLPIIVISAQSDPETRSFAVRLGAHAFMAKPVDLNDFGRAVRDVLGATS